MTTRTKKREDKKVRMNPGSREKVRGKKKIRIRAAVVVIGLTRMTADRVCALRSSHFFLFLHTTKNASSPFGISVFAFDLTADFFFAFIRRHTKSERSSSSSSSRSIMHSFVVVFVNLVLASHWANAPINMGRNKGGGGGGGGLAAAYRDAKGTHNEWAPHSP